jgi:ArsR family transcriptional regulator, lead/cadmium/zinc/bismuth-responsive transcriptional repressor
LHSIENGGVNLNGKSTWSLKSYDEMKKIRRLGENQFPKAGDNVEMERIASFFKGLGDETRLRIISLLWFNDLCMCEIVSALESASSTISHHLKIMEKGGIIVSRREGKFTIYSLNKEHLKPVMPYLIKEGDKNV